MSLALAGHAPATFEIKSAHLSLVALLLKSPDLTLLAAELDQRYGDMPGFFEGENTLIDLQPLQAVAPEAALDFGTLLPLLERHQLRPLAVRGGSEAQMAQALAAGLVAAPDAVMARSQAPAAAASTAQAPVAAPAAEPAPVPPGALVIDRPLRSGQQVYARGRDLVVMAMVNPGAEVIADGHIHVYAPLRGKAIAGARGMGDARIFALAMAPELISIAGIYRTSEVPLPETIHNRPAQIRLDAGPDGDRLVIEPLSA
ncbi:septum site-determining protein MinC [Hydrogenophaga sp. IBVHS2]|uniref:septum site-determining protein MinC n=1 Tax=Hydrogenophaga sp. IBVHS2 TaxID=1985170 RepID=UPI000A2DCA6C|nr:septum site-determining protein MinC [Hydrogenophaga sp. IBVHS2]OSZ63352.1 septum site-determining protein MinC [Hydrogenophaga sp. IBVHS2]